MDTWHDTRVNCIKPERRKRTADDTCSSCDTWRIVCEVHYAQEEEAQRRRLSIHHVHNLRTVSPQRFRRASRCKNLKKEYQVCVANLEATTMRRRRMKTTGEVAAWGERWRNAEMWHMAHCVEVYHAREERAQRRRLLFIMDTTSAQSHHRGSEETRGASNGDKSSQK